MENILSKNHSTNGNADKKVLASDIRGSDDGFDSSMANYEGSDSEDESSKGIEDRTYKDALKNVDTTKFKESKYKDVSKNINTSESKESTYKDASKNVDTVESKFYAAAPSSWKYFIYIISLHFGNKSFVDVILTMLSQLVSVVMFGSCWV